MEPQILQSSNPVAIIASLPPGYELKIGRKRISFLLKCLMLSRFDIVHALLDSNLELNINLSDYNHTLPIMWAIKLNKPDIIIKLLNRNCIIDSSIIIYAIGLKKFKICKLILTHRQDIEIDNLLIDSIIYNNVSPDNIPKHYRIYNKLIYNREYKYLHKVIKYYDDFGNIALFNSLFPRPKLMIKLITERPDYIKSLLDSSHKQHVYEKLINYLYDVPEEIPKYLIDLIDFTLKINHTPIFNLIYNCNSKFRYSYIYKSLVNQGKLTNKIISDIIEINIKQMNQYSQIKGEYDTLYTPEIFILKYGHEEEKQKIYTKYNAQNYILCITNYEFIKFNFRSDQVKYEEFYKSKFLFMILTQIAMPQNKNLQIVAQILRKQNYYMIFDLIEKAWGLQAIHGYHKKIKF